MSNVKEQAIAKFIPDTRSYWQNNGSIVDIKNEVPKDGKKFSLKELQDFVSGYIEILPSNLEGFSLVCNEESKCVDEWRVNEVATKLYKFGNQDVIAGNVLFVSNNLLN